MNIHFTDPVLYADLKSQSVASITIGSHMYGLNNINSDIDKLIIYIEPEKNRNSILWEHHQLQYKLDGVDYNFSTLQTFIRNALTGDATINFEVIWSDEILKTDLAWLADYRYLFVNYNIIKSYLGMAKRDLKYWKRDTNNGKKHSAETHKKLSHFVRGVIFAKMLINMDFTMNLSKTRTFTEFNYTDLELLDRIKNGALDYSFSMLTDLVEKQMHIVRVENNTHHDNGEIKTYMDPSILREIDYKVGEMTTNFNAQVFRINYGDMFYEALENGVVYTS